MTESDADFFFGRARETAEVIRALADMPDKLPVLLGNSGVGKSSLAQAGAIATLVRQAWPETAEAPGAWPPAFNASRRWCFLKLKPGTEPVRALVEPFLWTWQLDAVDPRRAELQSSWVGKLVEGKVTLRDLLDATQARYRDELHQPEPPAFLIYIDQGEELYARGEERQRRRFSEVLGRGLGDPRLRAMISMRADFVGDLQKDEPLYAAHRQINVPPLREAQLREVVSRPAALLSAGFEPEELAADIAGRTAAESAKDAGALPLLSYLLDDMWTGMVKRGDGKLCLPRAAVEIGAVLVDRADAFLATHPNSEDKLRRIFTLRLATVREGEEPTRRRAARSEFTDEEWRLVTELADHPNRLLVTATPEAGETYAEVAHEAVFRRWAKLRDEWIAAEREFLAWRTGLEAARRAWRDTPDSSKSDALLMGAALTQAQSWLEQRGQDLSSLDRDFIGQGIQRERRAKGRARRVQALVYALLVGIILGLIGVINEAYVREQVNWYWTMRPWRVANVDPYVLKSEAERALKPGDSFRECAKDCPEVVVVPAGEFIMGSPKEEAGHQNNEEPQHRVVFAKPLAVSKLEVTFDQWDACVTAGGCTWKPADLGMGRGIKPVIDVSWDDAQQYVGWFSRMTGKTYRLLTEAEFEYAARAGTQTAYFWGDEIGNGNANCDGCGSSWDNRETSPAGSFKPNSFGLYDMLGNVWEWTEDCVHGDYNGAPQDGSAWIADGDCGRRVVRGGSWIYNPQNLRSAHRDRDSTGTRYDNLGFRVARTLSP
jgi:formylglycine-generating enzyme required for sulfatase activity